MSPEKLEKMAFLGQEMDNVNLILVRKWGIEHTSINKRNLKLFGINVKKSQEYIQKDSSSRTGDITDKLFSVRK